MSLKAFIFKKVVRFTMPRTMNIYEKREKTEVLASRYKVPEGISFEPIELSGVKSELAIKPGADRSKVIIYLHGGAYCYNSINTYKAFSGGIALASSIPVLSVNYRLAPENPYPAALEDVITVYHELLSQGFNANNIVFMGDSAGGGLSLAVAMYLRDHNEPIPAGLALLSPLTDLTMTSESNVRLAKKDPILNIEFERFCAKVYSSGKDLKDPYISPCFGSFKGLPPMIVHCGTIEIGADDHIKLNEKALIDKVDITFKMWKGMFHDFTVFCEYTPEGMKSFLEIVSWIKEKLLYTDKTKQ